MNMSIGKRMKEKREQRQMTLDELSKLVGVTRQTLSRYETGVINNIPSDMIESISNALRTTPAQLMGWDDDGKFDVFSLPGVLPVPRMVKKPLLGAIACGDPILAVQNLDGYVDTPEGIHCDFALRCKGDSMVGARIHDGDVVYIRLQDDIENSEIAAVIIDEEEVTLKRVYKLPHGMILQAENPAYAPIQINGSHSARIIGKAVGFTSIIK
ncbi:MAG TPA: S24 family peptidase [Clostridia bacterium]|nr:S24 family peptidase [Clostridia bacterium]